MGSMLGVSVSTGFCAGVRARAARLLESEFLPRVRELLRRVGVLHADETPGRAAGGLTYVHATATEYLTVMHTAGRSAADIDAGQVLPGYAGTIVRGWLRWLHPPDRRPPRLVRCALPRPAGYADQAEGDRRFPWSAGRQRVTGSA